MPFIHSVKYALGLSNVRISSKLPSYSKHYLANMPAVEKFAKENKMILNFVPTAQKKTGTMAEMQVKSRGFVHAAACPEAAVTQNTGDAIYIPVEKTLFKTNVFDSRTQILNKLLNFVNKK